MSQSNSIQAALAKLDVSNDNHWTSDGLPRLDTVKMLAGDASITREAVTAAWPGFTRTAAAQGAQPPEAAMAPASTEETVQAPTAVTPPATNDEDPDNAPDDANSGRSGSVAQQTQSTEVQAVVNVDDRLGAAQAELVVLAKAKADADKAYAAKVAEVDALLIEQESSDSADTNQAAIGRYLDTQKANGQERARKIAALKGIDLSAILPKKAPIDAVRSRQLGYGGRRK